MKLLLVQESAWAGGVLPAHCFGQALFCTRSIIFKEALSKIQIRIHNLKCYINKRY